MRIHPLLLVALALSCGQRTQKNYVGTPAVELVQEELTDSHVQFRVNSLNCDAVFVCCRRGGDKPTADQIAEAGVQAGSTVSFDRLLPSTDYTAYAVGRRGTEEWGEIASVHFRTEASYPELRPWEAARSGVPSFSDLTLVSSAQHRPNPPKWTEERFGSHVTWTDAENKEDWLFEAFLCLEVIDAKRGLTYSIGNSHHSATKESWTDLLDYWLAPGGALATLDKTVEKAAGRIGMPPAPRYVVLVVPDPIMFEHFADKNSSTTYWGELDGSRLDFAKVEDQIAACTWYCNEARRRFETLAPKHLELAGFYILSEELPYAGGGATEGYNAQYKRWETIVPALTAHLHKCREGLYWIPYHLAPGYKKWKEWGIDMAFMQPNYYWDYKNDQADHPFARTTDAMRTYGMGMETEFEYSLVTAVMKQPGMMGPDGEGRMIYTLADVPGLKDQFREYMTRFRDGGFYGKVPLAIYTGTDAMHQLASSTEPDDVQLYREFCAFITGSPLRRK